jgi:hypothetical protein
MKGLNSLGSLESIQLKLDDFFKQINGCIEKSEWDDLNIVLDARQQLLEQIFNDALPKTYQGAARQFAELILEQDAVFLDRIEKQKELSIAQQASFERNVRALQAYIS